MRMLPSDGVHEPQHHSWLSDHLIDRGRGRPYRWASRDARTARSTLAERRPRSMRLTISATQRSSSALVMLAGIDTRSTPFTSRAWTVLRRLGLRITSTFIIPDSLPGDGDSDSGYR